jgi:ferric-dicitrate binding protein FerR (iron transport regulator)
LTTPRGGQHQLDLSDGTRVWLNAASSITYPTAFAGKERRVQVSGEVYFEVVHNKFKPFKVDVQGTHIDDIGTSFNINAYGDENNIKTTLLEGSVEITTTKAIQIIKPGQQALTESGGSKIEISRDVDIEKVMAWHNGKIILSNVSVEQIMREISRWYDMDIEYMGTIPNKQFYGSIRRDVRLSIILNALKDYGVETTIEGKKIIVQ